MDTSALDSAVAAVAASEMTLRTAQSTDGTAEAALVAATAQASTTAKAVTDAKTAFNSSLDVLIAAATALKAGV